MRIPRWSLLGIAFLAVAACDGTMPTTAPPSVATSFDRDGNARNVAFDRTDQPFGRSMEHWTEEWWRWELSVPTADNPSLDQTGADCGRHQHGIVWNLGASFGSSTVVRNCAIPGPRALLANLSGILNDYPCPDPNFHPAPGQSLQDFLTQGARGAVDAVNALTLTVDGVSVPQPLTYRFHTPLFYFEGDPSLTTSIDGCITGTPQPAVADGYLVMLKPLGRGTHTVIFTSSDTQGTNTSITYHLTIGDRD